MGKRQELFLLTQRMTGLREIPGQKDHPFIVWCHNITEDDDPNHIQAANSDEVAWCSSFINERHYQLRLARSKSRLARSWLGVGRAVSLEEALPGDVVVLSRGPSPQPGPEILTAPGHVGLFAGLDVQHVWLLGGNQSNMVSTSPYDRNRVLGVRRTAED